MSKSFSKKQFLLYMIKGLSLARNSITNIIFIVNVYTKNTESGAEYEEYPNVSL